MNMVVILLALAGCIGCSSSTGQKDNKATEEAVETKAPQQVKADNEEMDEDVLDNGEKVYTRVEVMPQFPGGDAELLKFLAENIKYPKESQENGDQGRVICSFVIKSDGTLTNYKVIRGLTTLLDQEALRVLQAMPRWTPGTEGGKPVAVKYTVPITYKLQ